MTAGTTTRTGDVVVTHDLTKRFRSGQVAVDDVRLAVPRGSIYGFLGPNGSGKTTTIRMLLGLITPTAGNVYLLGEPMPSAGLSVLPRIGSLVEGPAFHPYLSGAANLRRLDRADASADPRTSRARLAAALERVGLTSAATKRYRSYSLGMKQRLGIAAALLVPRELLILDEPTNGLDPQGTREIRTLVRDIASDGHTVLVSSHLLAEIEQIATHVGIMSVGRLVAQGPLDDVLQAPGGELVEITTPDPAAAARLLTGLGLTASIAGPNRLTAPLGKTPAEQVAATLVGGGVALQGLVVRRPSLESLFVALTGEGFDVAG